MQSGSIFVLLVVSIQKYVFDVGLHSLDVVLVEGLVVSVRTDFLYRYHFLQTHPVFLQICIQLVSDSFNALVHLVFDALVPPEAFHSLEEIPGPFSTHIGWVHLQCLGELIAE